MNIVFMGTPYFSVKILAAVHKEYGVNLVVTQPDKLVGRKKVLTPSPVKEKALELGIEVFQPKRIKTDYSRILEVKPDIIITAAYGQIIGKEVIDYPRLGSINVHGSLLPLLREPIFAKFKLCSQDMPFKYPTIIKIIANCIIQIFT